MALTDLITAAGASIAITATAPATENLAGFSALSYTTVAAVESLGELGLNFADVTFTPLETRQVLHFKGSKDGAGVSIAMAFDPVDSGQAVVEAAHASDSPYSFKVVLQDGTTGYFAGRVMSFPLAVGAADSMVMRTATVQPSTDFYYA